MTIHQKPTMQPADTSKRRELGGSLYLFTYRRSAFANKVIISSHGGMMTSGVRTFETEGNERFYFYSIQGSGAKASSLNTATYENTATERVGPGTCPNYFLSKWQGYHSSAKGEGLETYGSIQQYQEKKDSEDLMYNRAFADFGRELALKAMGTNPGAMKWEVGDERQDFDVLTVRNRFYNSGVTLEYAVKKLRELHRYQEIHCAFCRV